MIKKMSIFGILLALYFLAPQQATPIVLTGYDPMLGGINCEEPCGQTASGYWWQESDYWNGVEGLAACPPRWLGRTLYIQGFGTLHCLDRGGAIKYAYNSYYDRFVYHVDVLVQNPKQQEWNYRLYENWELR